MQPRAVALARSAQVAEIGEAEVTREVELLRGENDALCAELEELKSERQQRSTL